MVFEAHGMSFPCTELLLFNYAKVNTVFHSMAPLSLKHIYLDKTQIQIYSKSLQINVDPPAPPAVRLGGAV